MSNRLVFGFAMLAILALVLLVAVIFGVRLITLDTPSASIPENTRASYVVKEGDSLSRISEKTGVPLTRIEELNPALDPLSLVPGQRLKLKATPTRRPSARARRRKRGPSRYVVKPGDALFGIAEKTGVDVDRLRSLNPQYDLKVLLPGMRLKLRR